MRRRPSIGSKRAGLEGLTITHRYGSVPAVAGRIGGGALAQLREDPEIESIEIDAEGSGQLREAVAAIGGDQARNLYGLTGKGVRVAVLDTGLDLTHPICSPGSSASDASREVRVRPCARRPGPALRTTTVMAANGLSFPSIRALAAVRAACPDLAEEATP